MKAADTPALGAHGIPVPVFELALKTGQPWVSAAAHWALVTGNAIDLMKRKPSCAIVRQWVRAQAN
ncbi:MAG TPA: hypothetical protein PLU30_24480 [Verrucomicrobiae bacterium]|nr:hypothetical protein [Verrucomicrobiae bacterium]